MADSPDHCIDQIAVKEGKYLNFHSRYNTFLNSFTYAEHSEGMFCLKTAALQKSPGYFPCGECRRWWSQLACVCKQDSDSVNAHVSALNVITLKEYRHLLRALCGHVCNYFRISLVEVVVTIKYWVQLASLPSKIALIIYQCV